MVIEQVFRISARRMRAAQLFSLIGVLMVAPMTPVAAQEETPSGLSSQESQPLSILALSSVLARVEHSHPLLQGSQTQKTVAAGKLLKALGQFEPSFVNDWELERLVKDGETKSVGFNDTFVEMRHPWGVKGFAGFRVGLGDVEVADLSVKESNQPLLGIAFPILRGLMTNPEHAELKKSSLAERQAELEIQQTRQELYLGATRQYWNWVAAWKFRGLQQQAVEVAEARAAQLTKQAKEGARAQFDVIEANQEVQRRRERLIRATRKVDQEEFKLALFLWKDSDLDVPKHYRPPAFPAVNVKPLGPISTAEQQRAITRRPEVQLVHLEAELNNIDLEVAENNFLPTLNADAQPTRKPGEFVLGLGYRFGVQFSIPFLQRDARGDLLQMEGKAKRLQYLKHYRVQQVSMDVANAKSAVDRAQERIQVAEQALTLARKLERGERTRFKLGATSLLFVNLRERDVLQAAEGWITAMADSQKAQALYQWAIGAWIKAPSST